MTLPYTPQYYTQIGEGSRASAAAAVPLVMELLRPASVIDVGCGSGAWLAAFKRHGAAEAIGVDGDYVDPASLEIEQREFIAADLAQPLRIARTFDLAVSLEVAEHLSASAAGQFIDTLTRLAPAVLFSAAVPHQGGEHHVNEQWPAYWVEQFSSRNFLALDPLRRLLWQRPEVDWWYAQNMLLFVRRDRLPRYPRLQSEWERSPDMPVLPLVHPRSYLHQAWRNRVLEAAVEVATAVPAGATVIVIDDGRFGTLYLPNRPIMPFLECGGVYAGPPRDDEQAVGELRRMQQAGARFVAVGWPAFWWLDHYHGFAAHLERQHSLLVRSERVVVFALRG